MAGREPTEDERYQAGNITWYEYRGDLELLERQFEKCLNNSASLRATLPYRCGCVLQRRKLSLLYYVSASAKYVLGSAAVVFAILTLQHGRPFVSLLYSSILAHVLTANCPRYWISALLTFSCKSAENSTSLIYHLSELCCNCDTRQTETVALVFSTQPYSHPSAGR